MAEDGNTAVLEQPTSAAPPETASDDTPAPASSTPESTGQVGGAEGQDGGAQGQASEGSETPALSDHEALQQALEARRAFNAGKADTLTLDTRQRALLRSYDDRVDSQRALDAKVEAQRQEQIKKLESRFTDAGPQVVGALNDVLTDLGVDLSPVQQKYLQDKLGGTFTGLKSELGDILIEPLVEYERSSFRRLLEAQGMYSSEVGRALRDLPLLTDGEKPSIMTAAFNAGFYKGQQAGPDADSVVLKKGELEKRLKDAEKAVHDTYKAQGIKGPVSGRNTEPVDARSEDQILLDPNTPIEEVNRILARRNGQ